MRRRRGHRSGRPLPSAATRGRRVRAAKRPLVKGAVAAQNRLYRRTPRLPLRGAGARSATERCPGRQVCSPVALGQRGLVCLRRGTFHRGKVPKTRLGLRPPVPLLGCAACIPGSGIAQAVALHQAVPSHTACPFPASRRPVESEGRYGYITFLKGRTDCPGTGVGLCTRQFYNPSGRPQACHLPLHRGGLGLCVQRSAQTPQPIGRAMRAHRIPLP